MTTRSMCFDYSQDSIFMKHVTSLLPQEKMCVSKCALLAWRFLRDDMECCLFTHIFSTTAEQQEKVQGPWALAYPSSFSLRHPQVIDTWPFFLWVSNTISQFDMKNTVFSWWVHVKTILNQWKHGQNEEQLNVY